MYARCGAFAKARQVLEELPVRNVVTWTALIAGYAQQGQGKEALECFDSMQWEGHCPNVVTFNCALKACGITGAVGKAEQIHDIIASSGMLERNIVLGNTLVDTYARCGALAKAQRALKELPIRNVITWTALIAGYAQQGKGEEALECFDAMLQEGHIPDALTFTCALKACGSIGAAAKGEQIYRRIMRSGMLGKDVVLKDSLVDMFVRCGALAKAHQVLEEFLVRDVTTWNALIAGYSQQGQEAEALKCFDSMQREGHSPDIFTFIYALKACGGSGAVSKGKQIHDKIISLGMLDKNIVIGNALVDMYARCGALAKAQQALKDLPECDVVTWNTLIAGYAQQGQGEEALKCFDSMQREGHSPSAVTYICALKACGITGSIAMAAQIHKRIVSLGMLEESIVLGNTLVDMYVKCGALAKAEQALKDLPVRNVVTWTALIAGYAQQGKGEEALKCFDRMQQEGNPPNAVTFICALRACGSIGAAAKGEEIHSQLVKLDMLKKDVVLKNALVDMYANCGALLKSLAVFEELSIQSVASWNALIGGYAQQGQNVEAANCFKRMQSKGVRPNSTTLLGMLNVCSQSGLSNEAEMFFLEMNTKHGITADLEHYCCMVDLFGRAGNFNKALHVIEQMPFAEYLPMWVAFLSACRKWGEVSVGRLAFERGVHLDKSYMAIYVCMGYIYAEAGMPGEADKIIEVMIVANQA